MQALTPTAHCGWCSSLQETPEGGATLVKEPGLTMWHDTVRHLFGSEDTAQRIPICASLQLPTTAAGQGQLEAWVPLPAPL